MDLSTESSAYNAEVTTEIPPPKGWTTTLKELSIDYYWARDKSIGQLEAKSLGLTSPKPVMCTTPDSGNCMHMFQSGSYFYIWNEIEGEVWQITSPTELKEIFSTMTNKGMDKLVIKLVD